MMITGNLPIVRVYADTSVYGGVFDEEFSGPSRTFFERIREGRFTLVVSALVEEELRNRQSKCVSGLKNFARLPMLCL